MASRLSLCVILWGAASAALTLSPELSWHSAPVLATQNPGPRGAKVTFERVLPATEPKQAHSLRTRLVSLAVERGEVPSPFLEPGYFRATYRATVTIPVRDRYRFRIDGRGKAKLTINGAVVLDGPLRAQKPLETDKKIRLDKGANDLVVVFESSAFGDGQMRLFWQPPECGFEPIPPEMLSWKAEDADIEIGARLRHGQQLFADRRCARCHEFRVRRYGESAFGELDAGGPDLRAAGARMRRDWIAAWLLDPTAFRSDASMPTFGLSEKEADDVAAYLGGLGAPLDAEFATDAAEKGRARFLELGCVACHVPPDRLRSESALGDRMPLHHVAQKWFASGLVAYLQDPQESYPHVRMPDFKLSRDDATNLAAYLMATPGEPLRATRGDVDRGRRLVKQHQCANCHALDLPAAETVAPAIGALGLDEGCLAKSAAKRKKAPDHSLRDDERAALRAFMPFAEEVPFRVAPLDYAQRQLTHQRCTSCHGLDDQPSVWARVAEMLAVDDPLPAEQDPVAQGVPALTWVGAKLQPSWIARFVTGQEQSPRPWLHARMPQFEMRGDAISAGLVREHGYGAADEPAMPANAQMAIHGEKLVQMGGGFGCVQCHALGDKPPVQVFDRQGIELFTARRRLRHEYYARWLLDPPRIDPDSRMPKYANSSGKTAFTEILGGDAVQQFEAIWQFLGSRR